MSEQQKRQIEPVKDMSTIQLPLDDESADSIDMMELFFRLLASWKLILCCAVVLSIVSGVVTQFFITPMYQATTSIYVLSRDSALNLSDLNLGTALTNDYIKIFNMWEVHAKVKENLSLDYSYGELSRRLTVTNSNNTRILEISFTSPSPEEARDVANEYADVASQFIEETMSTDRPNRMSEALLPTSPISPNKTRNIMIGFLLGAFIAAGIVLLRYMLDDKYKTAEDIRKYTGLNTLAAIPDEEDTDEDFDRGRREL